MSHIRADRVEETSTTTGTGALTLAGAVSYYRAFGAVMADTDTCVCLIVNASAAEWELSLCTYASGGNTLTRSTIYASNTGSAINFSAGTKTISLVPVASKMVVMDNNGDASVTGTLTAATLNATSAFKFAGVNILLHSGVGGSAILYDGAGANVIQAKSTDVEIDTDLLWLRGSDHSTQYGRLTSTGLAIGNVVPATRLHIYESAASFKILAKLQNDTGGSGTAALGFDVTNSASETPVCKAAMGLLRGAAQGTGDFYFLLRDDTDTTEVSLSDVVMRIQASGHILPGTDNLQDLGNGSLRMRTIYAGTGTINTSGRDAKVGIVEPSAAERMWASLIKARGPMRYRFKDAVDVKGDAARFHFGYIAEDILEDAEAAGIANPWAYGFLCSDPVIETETYFETATRPKMRTVPSVESAVKVIDGRPVMVRKEVTRDEPVGELVAVVDEEGQFVLRQVGTTDEGEPIMAPLMYFVPEMEDYEVERTREVDTGKVRLGLRYSELEAFLRAAD